MPTALWWIRRDLRLTDNPALAAAMAAIHDYHNRRDLPAVDGTSRLSPYLRHGMISARAAAVRALDPAGHALDPAVRAPDTALRGAGAETWLSELIWRDFFIHILHHFPRVLGESFRPELTGVPERLIHRPWEMPGDVQRAAGCVIGRDYPEPVVDHAWARGRVLAAYRAGRR